LSAAAQALVATGRYRTLTVAEQPVALFGPTRVGANGRFQLWGLTLAMVANVELRFADEPPVHIPSAGAFGIALEPAGADLDPRLRPLSKQDFDLAGIDIVVNTHLHFDHCGGNHLFAGRPIYVQRRELDDARSEDDYTIREWVEAPGVRYVPVDGELELLPGLRLVPAPGHTRGMQVVVVETGGRPVVVGGDVAVWFGELDEPHTEGQLRVRALDPELVWLAHEHEPWRPRSAPQCIRPTVTYK
jgi:N-acyl homoserine lactone hydrolase